MSNYCLNYIIVTHEEKSKINDLYQNSSTDKFFDKILPPPADPSKNPVESYRDMYGPLGNWRIKNWGTHALPMFDDSDERKISTNGTIFTFRFDTKVLPPIGIYEELERQGFRVKAYYIEPLGCHFCGSYIYGIHEYFEYMKPDQDVPPDIEWCFNVKEWKKLASPIPPKKQTADDKHDEETDVDGPRYLNDSEAMAYFQDIES